MHPPGRCLYVSLDAIEGSKDTVAKSEWIDYRYSRVMRNVTISKVSVKIQIKLTDCGFFLG